MQNYSIIEDLAPDHCHNINLKNHLKALEDCIKRNLFLIRRYCKGNNKPTMGIFKKLLLPGYIQEFNSKILETKKRFSQSFAPSSPIIKEVSEQIIPASFSTFNELQPCIEKSIQLPKEQQKIIKTEPSVKLIQEKTKLLNPKILSLLENFDSCQNLQNKLLLEEKNKPLFKVRSARKMIPVQKLSQIRKNQKSKEFEENILSCTYNDSIGFRKRKFFAQKSQNQATFPKFNKQQQDSLINLTYIRNSYTDEKSLSKKMFALMRQRKSTRILKAKLFSQLEDKNLQLDQSQKENFTIKKYDRKASFEIFNQSSEMNLKGSVFTPFINRPSLNLIDHNRKISYEMKQHSTINFRQKKVNKIQKKNILANLKERFSLLDEKERINDLTHKIFGAHKLLTSSDKKFRLPHFNQAQ